MFFSPYLCVVHPVVIHNKDGSRVSQLHLRLMDSYFVIYCNIMIECKRNILMWCTCYVVIFLEYFYIAWWWIFKQVETCCNNNNQQNVWVWRTSWRRPDCLYRCMKKSIKLHVQVFLRMNTWLYEKCRGHYN